MVHIGFRSHHHLEGGDDFVTGGAVPGGPKQSVERKFHLDSSDEVKVSKMKIFGYNAIDTGMSV